jgi:glycosyltransferase involved in cell wall biosynthesis
MRVIFATPIYPPEVGGPATYTVDLAERMRGEHHITIVAYADGAEPVPSTHLVSISKKQTLPIRLVRFYEALLREAKQADLIYAQNAVAAGLPAVLVGRRLNKPVILKFVGDEAWERAAQAGKTKKQLEDFYKAPQGGLKAKLFMAIQGFVLRRASLVTTPSAYLGELLINYYGVKREDFFVNYNAVDVPPLSQGERKPRQIMTGVRLVAWKGVEGIIKALAIIKNKFPTAALVVAGEGPELERLKQAAVWEDVAASVHFAGRLSKKGTLELQSSSAVQVLNSSYEGLPHGALESFATRTPIVATDIPGTNEAVLNEKTGLLVPAGDEQALARAIERMLTDTELRERVVEGGAQILKEKFSWEAHLKRLNEMFQKVQS